MASQETGNFINPQIGYWSQNAGQLRCFGEPPHRSDGPRGREKVRLDPRAPLLQYHEGIPNANC